MFFFFQYFLNFQGLFLFHLIDLQHGTIGTLFSSSFHAKEYFSRNIVLFLHAHGILVDFFFTFFLNMMPNAFVNRSLTIRERMIRNESRVS